MRSYLLNQDINKLKLFFFDEKKLDFIFDNFYGIPLIETAFNIDCENRNNICTSFFSSFFYSNKEFQIKFLNHICENNHSIKENIFIYNEAINILKFFVSYNFIDLKEEQEITLKNKWELHPVFDFLHLLNNGYCLETKKNENLTNNVINQNNFKIKTGLFYYSVIYDNFPAIQYFLSCSKTNKYKDELNRIDSIGFNYLTHAILNSSDTTCSLLLSHSKFKQQINLKTSFKFNQIESVFYLLSGKVNLINFYDHYNDELNKIVKNIYNVFSTLNLKTEDFILKSENSILIHSIMNNNIRFFDFLYKRFFINLNKKINGLFPVEWCSKFYNTNFLLKICEYQKIYNHNYFYHNNEETNEYYVSFIDTPFFYQFVEKDNFEIKRYELYLKILLNNFQINLKEKNQFGNTHLHSICYVLGKDFYKYFEIFKIFIEDFKLDPTIENKKGVKCYELISNKEHKKIVAIYLNNVGYNVDVNFKSINDFNISNYDNKEIKIKTSLNIIEDEIKVVEHKEKEIIIETSKEKKKSLKISKKETMEL